MERIKFSIVCPVYNSELYIDECVQSVIRQTFRNWELILVNDGSTDNSGLICKKYSSIDKRIITINQQNQGPYISRINGIKAATGEYVLFLDSDDFFLDDSLQSLWNQIAAEKSIDVLLFNFVKDRNAKYDELTFIHKNGVINSPSRILDFVFCKNNIGNLCRFCVKKTIFNTADLSLGNKSRYTEDALFLSNILIAASKMKITFVQIYYYRNNSFSVTHNLTSNDKFNRFENYNSILQSIYEFTGNVILSDENVSLYTWLPFSYIASSKKDNYSLFKNRCIQIKNSFIFNHICKQNRHLSKTRSIFIYLIEKKLFFLLRAILFVRKFG